MKSDNCGACNDERGPYFSHCRINDSPVINGIYETIRFLMNSMFDKLWIDRRTSSSLQTHNCSDLNYMFKMKKTFPPLTELEMS
jgi:hypothetical protein